MSATRKAPQSPSNLTPQLNLLQEEYELPSGNVAIQPTLFFPTVPTQSALSESLSKNPANNHISDSPSIRPSDSDHPERTVGNWQMVYPYHSHGVEYFRYAYGTNAASTVHHIPGGNTLNPIAQSRATEVSRWIALGKPPRAIVSLIDSWRRGARQK